MIISIIASMSKNRVIGLKGRLPWYIPEDLEWFREKTDGHIILMGRKTYESLRKRPLPGRISVVLTKNQDYSKTHGEKDVVLMDSLEKALIYAKEKGENELFVIGGEIIYRETLPIADRIYLTVIDKEFKGDRFFPHFDPGKYNIIYSKTINIEPELKFYIYEKKL